MAKLDTLTVYRRNDGSRCVVNTGFDASIYSTDVPKKRGRRQPLRSAPINLKDGHEFKKLG